MGLFEQHYLENKDEIDARVNSRLAEKENSTRFSGSGYVPIGELNRYSDPSRQPQINRHHMADLQRQADDYNAQVRNYQRQQAAYQTYQDRMGMDVEQGKKELVLRDQETTERQTMIDMLNAQDWAKQNGAIQQHIAQLEAEQANEKAATNNLRTRVSEAEALRTAKAPMTATETEMENSIRRHEIWRNNPRDMAQIVAELEAAKNDAEQARSTRGTERGYLEDADYLEFSGASPLHAAELRRQAGDMAANEKIADQRVKDLEEEKYWTEYYKYMNLPQSEEYEKYAQIGKNRANPSVQDVIAAWQGGTYDEDMIRNIVEYSRANYDDVVSLVSPVGDELYSQMTEEEVNNYNYLLAKDGKEAAQAYLDFLSDQINRRKGHELAQPVTNIKSPFLRGVASLPGAFGNALGNAGEGIEQLITGEVKAPTASDYAEAEIRGGLGKGGQIAYDATAAVGNMAPSIAASSLFGPWAGLAMTGASSAGNAYAQAKSEGYSDEKARSYGLLVGASEALLQYALGGVGAIGGVTDDILMAKAQMLKSAVGRLALGGVIKIGTEVAEEELQLLLEPLFASIVLGEDYQAPTFGEAWDTAVVTALSTAILEGHSVAGVELNYKAYGDMVTKGRSKQDIVKSAVRYSEPYTNAGKLANDLANRMAKGQDVSNTDIGRLYSFMLTEKNADQFVDSLDILGAYDALAKEMERQTENADKFLAWDGKFEEQPVQDQQAQQEQEQFFVPDNESETFEQETPASVNQTPVQQTQNVRTPVKVKVAKKGAAQNDNVANQAFLPDNESERFDTTEPNDDREIEQGDVDELVEKYGAIPQGESPYRTSNVPRQTSDEEFVAQTIRTVLEAKATPDAYIPKLEELIANGAFSFERYTNQQAMDDAKDTIVHLGYQGALAKWMNDVERGKVSAKNTALGWELYRQAATAGDMESAILVLNDMVEHQHNAAQALQATRILKTLSPDAQLYGVQKSVSKLREELRAKFKDKAPDLQINENLAKQFLTAETDKARADALNAMYEDIGRQIPATFKERWDSWRYLAMLANPRTHIRNFVGNAAYVPMREASNQLSALGQLALPKEQRTRSLGFSISERRRALVDAARQDFETNTKDLVMKGEKYNSANGAIEKGRKIHKFKPLEAARKGNGDLLEWEDKIFAKQAYVSALSGYLNARGYTAEDFTGNGMTQQQKDDARSFAIKEAQRATYRDSNAFSDLVESIGFKKPKSGFQKGANMLIEGVLPFKKTPANILARAFEYSPAGVVAEVGRATVDGIKNKNFDAVQFIDNMSKGLTGSAVFALGYLLSKWGILAATPEDEEQGELEGRQKYSVKIGGKSFTLDFAAPTSIPLFMGAELYEEISNLTDGEALSISDLANVFKALVGPMENMSMLEGLNSTLESAGIAAQNDQSALGAIGASSALNYFMQAFPTIFGQVERAISKNERVRQTTFIDKDSKIPTGTQYTLGKAANKIPFYDFNQVPFIDAWGRVQENGNVAQRAANNMLNPSYVSDVIETDVDREIKRLEQATGENFTPARVKNNKISVDGKTIFMTEDEFTTYAMAKGQNDLMIRESLMKNPKYDSLSDDVKGKLQDASEDYAKVLAMQEAGLSPELTDWQEKIQDADINAVTDKLISNAIEATAKSKGKELGGDKYDGLAWLYDEGIIDESEARSQMTDTMREVYDATNANSKKFEVSDMIDVYAAATRADSNNKEAQFNAALAYIDQQVKDGAWNDTKATELAGAMGQVLKISIPKEQEPAAAWLKKYGAAGQQMIYNNMSDTQKKQYDWIKKAHGDLGITAYMFDTAVTYKDKLKTKKDAKGNVIKNVPTQFKDYLNSVYGSNTMVKRAIWDAIYESRSPWG